MALTTTTSELATFLDDAQRTERVVLESGPLSSGLVDYLVDLRRARTLAEDALHHLARTHGAKA